MPFLFVRGREVEGDVWLARVVHFSNGVQPASVTTHDTGTCPWPIGTDRKGDRNLARDCPLVEDPIVQWSIAEWVSGLHD